MSANNDPNLLITFMQYICFDYRSLAISVNLLFINNNTYNVKLKAILTHT